VKAEFLIDGKAHRASLEKTADGLDAVIDGNRKRFHYEETAAGRFVVETDDKKFRLVVREAGDRTHVWVNGRTIVLERRSPDEIAGITGVSDSHLTAPMPGTLRKLLVKEGDTVVAKQTVAILEAMKMEHNVRAPRDGKVAKIFFREGDVLGADATVLDLEPLEGETS
jgi:biotin carboxyl carrier protein